MMIGEAQVMVMNPIFRSFFSSGAVVCAIVSRAESGKIDAMAARAVLAPTAFKKPRRTLSFGKRLHQRGFDKVRCAITGGARCECG